MNVKIAAAAVVVVLAIGAYFLLGRDATEPTPAGETSTSAPVAPPAPLGGGGEPITEPLFPDDGAAG